MKVIAITIVVIALRMVPKSLEKRPGQMEIIRMKTIQFLAVLKLAGILRSVLKSREDLQSL